MNIEKGINLIYHLMEENISKEIIRENLEKGDISSLKIGTDTPLVKECKKIG